MADNIINSGDLTEKGGESTEELKTVEKPDPALEERFSKLVSSEGREGSFYDESGEFKPLPPLKFDELEQDREIPTPAEVEPGGQGDLQDDSEVLVRSVSGETDEVDRIERIDQVGLLQESVSAGQAAIGENVDALPEEGTLGDRILRGMQSVRERVEDGARQVESHIDPARETMSMREMFQTQWTMTNLLITEDYIGKVVSKGTQAFDTLLRNQ